MTPQRIVIVGAGQAAVQAIETLRRRGYAGSIILIGEEPFLPYQRPPLSKDFLLPGSPEPILIRPERFYRDHCVDVRLRTRVCEIDRAAQRVRLHDGEALAYDALLLATGGRPRRLQLPGCDLSGVHELRTLYDAQRLRNMLNGAKRLAILGGGYLGLEVAASCRKRGLDVKLFELSERLMQRTTSAPVSAFYFDEHVRKGVHVFCGTRVCELIGDPRARVREVACDDGSRFAADVVVVAVGLEPADELAKAAGLHCSGGISADEYCRTSEPNIFAAGDCSNHPNGRYGLRLRVESIDNACEQGASAALNMLGVPTAHDAVPSFWSDQYDLNLVTVGLFHGHDEVLLRGDVASRSFTACYLRQGELIAVDCINRPKDHLAGRKLTPLRLRPDRTKLADAALPLQSCI